MKKRTKLLYTAVITILLTGCGDESIIENQSEFDSSAFEITGKYNDVIVGKSPDNTIKYFLNNRIINSVSYPDVISKSIQQYYKLDVIGEDHIRISNPDDLTEFFELRDITNFQGGKLFDVYSSNGNYLKDIEVQFSSAQPKCGIKCWVGPVVFLVDVILDATTDSDCQTAIKECRAAGGLPSTEIEEGFWGDKCKVTCNPKDS